MGNKYVLFAYSSYYPSGGWNDMVAITDTLEDAKQSFDAETYENAEIVYLDNDPRLVSFWVNKDFRDLRRRLKGQTWYDEGSDGFEVSMQGSTRQFSNLEPFEPELVSEWQRRLQARSNANAS